MDGSWTIPLARRFSHYILERRTRVTCRLVRGFRMVVVYYVVRSAFASVRIFWHD